MAVIGTPQNERTSTLVEVFGVYCIGMEKKLLQLQNGIIRRYRNKKTISLFLIVLNTTKRTKEILAFFERKNQIIS
jgi:hypothetical protein